MNRIGITQRVEITTTNERRDCLDQRWSSLLDRLNFSPVPLPNYLPKGGAGAILKTYQLDGLLLSGGNDPVGFGGKSEASERDELELALIKECSAIKMPVIGVCRGAEILFIHHGGRITPITNHVNVNHTVKIEAGFFTPSVLNTTVNSFHSFGLDKSTLPSCLEICALGEDNSIEAFKHKILPQFAVLWHPERESPFRDFDLNLFKQVYGESK